MSTQAISAEQVGQNSAYDTLAGKISELTRLEQNIRNMKSEYKSYSKTHDLSCPDVNAKIKELDSLISKVQQQIEQIKRDEKKQETKASKNTGSSASSYRYLGSTASIYKRAFSLAHRACSEACAALSGSLHAPSAIVAANLSDLKKSSGSSTDYIENALNEINTAQTQTPGAAISAAFSEGIDVLK